MVAAFSDHLYALTQIGEWGTTWGRIPLLPCNTFSTSRSRSITQTVLGLLDVSSSTIKPNSLDFFFILIHYCSLICAKDGLIYFVESSQPSPSINRTTHLV